ncbi:MAG: hydrogenase maturation nickel metallochaperone HypA [Synergistaceae bacterium]|nr:hydrogenase maturation nickel metallochaperone HypA [Synergistaceae bacterium]
MHEMSLVEALLDSLLPLCAENGWKKVERIHLKIGSLRQVIPEALVFCFKTASAGTPLAEAEIEIAEIGIRQKCERCGLEWGGEIPLGRCAACGSIEITTTAGFEMEIDSLEVWDNDDETD